MRNYPRTFDTVGKLARQHDLLDLVRQFLYTQFHPEFDGSPSDIPLHLCPAVRSKISVYHSATAVFCAPSDPSGINGMYRKMIRSTPLWRKGETAAPRHDTIFLEKDLSQPGMRGLHVARVLLFFHLYSTIPLIPAHLFTGSSRWEMNQIMSQACGLWSWSIQQMTTVSCRLSTSTQFYEPHISYRSSSIPQSYLILATQIR